MLLFKVAEEETLANEDLGSSVHCGPAAHAGVAGTEGFVIRTASAVRWLSRPLSSTSPRQPMELSQCPGPQGCCGAGRAPPQGGLRSGGVFACVRRDH